ADQYTDNAVNNTGEAIEQEKQQAAYPDIPGYPGITRKSAHSGSSTKRSTKWARESQTSTLPSSGGRPFVWVLRPLPVSTSTGWQPRVTPACRSLRLSPTRGTEVTSP